MPIFASYDHCVPIEGNSVQNLVTFQGTMDQVSLFEMVKIKTSYCLTCDWVELIKCGFVVDVGVYKLLAVLLTPFNLVEKMKWPTFEIKNL
jgi:hypothetical protein